MMVIDCEVCRDYFLLMFKNIETGKSAAFEMFEGQPLNILRIKQLMQTETTISFNGIGYDLIIISAALSGWTCERLKALSDKIILSKLPAWRVARDSKVSVPRNWDHIDLIEVAPGKASLKIYGGRLQAKRMQDLPIKPDASIRAEDRAEMKTYCRNDLDTTESLYRALEPAIELRDAMGKQYGGIDLRSKSDAQIAEAVIKHELTELTGKEYRPAKVDGDQTFRYNDPGIVSFHTPQLRDNFKRLLETPFPIGLNGAVKMPEWLQKTRIKIGNAQYQMGIGGLHSCEKSQSVRALPDEILADFDVASYYPSIILKLKLAPEAMGDDFLRIYQNIVTRRLEAKRTKNTLMAETLKITVNGSFGKLGSMYSSLYAPQLLIQTTITGQLCLLMLIEAVESIGAKVMSANTDGIVILCNKNLEGRLSEIMFDWMLNTSFELERSDYSSIHSRDVNNYIAIKLDGKAKRKGTFSEPTLGKNPEFSIVNDALAAFLSIGTPIEKTICECRDVRRFVAVRRVDGGAEWRKKYLGKAVRFYYSVDTEPGEHISYAKNSNKVPRSDGAKPLMTLPDSFPEDVDHKRYILLANEALTDLGYDA